MTLGRCRAPTDGILPAVPDSKESESQAEAQADQQRAREREGQALAVLGRLQAASASQSPVSVMAAHMSLSCAGSLQSATADGIEIEIPNPPTATTLLGCTAAVSFPIGGKTAGFVADVTAVDLQADGTLLATLALPDDIRIGDRRTAVRIPVPKDALQVAVVGGDARGPTRPIDISLSGILIEVDARQAAAMPTGAVVLLSLARGPHDLRIEADVCRRDGLRLGLRFRCDDGPPRRLTQIMWKLQEARLPSR